MFSAVRILLTVALCFGAAMSLPAQQVSVDLLDQAVTGRLSGIDSSGVTIENGQKIGLDQVISVRFLEHDPSETRTLGNVQLLDGSTIPYSQWRSDQNALQFFVDADQSTPLSLTTKLNEVRAWRLPIDSVDDELSQWETTLLSKQSSDLLAVRRAPGSIDFISGAIESVDASGVGFSFQGQVIQVPWDRLYGMVFARPLESDPAPITIHGEQGLMLKASEVSFREMQLRANGRSFEAEIRSLGSLDWIDLSLGKMSFLSDLEEVHSEWHPSFPPVLFSGEPCRDESFDSGPITLRFPDPRAPGVWQQKQFAKGLALRSQTELVLELPPKASKLRGWIGIDPKVSATGSAEVTISVDDQTLLKTTVVGSAPPIQVDVPLPKGQRLRLFVDYGDNFDTGDIVHFANMRVSN